MASHRFHRVRARVATAIGVIVALTAGFFALAPSAFAHHTTIGGTTACSADSTAINVSWTASSWGSANQAQYYNPNIKVQYAVNGGSYTDVPSGSPGSFSANHLSFTGSFTVPTTTTSLSLKTIDVGTWGDGVAGGSKVATANVALPNPRCEPKGSLTIKKVTTGDTAPAPGTNFTFNVTGPQNFTLTAKSGDANGATRSNLPYGTYTIAEQSPPAGGVTYDPGNVAVVGANSKAVTVTATNAYRDYTGSLTFTKVVTGDLAQNGVTYTINYDGPDGNDGSVQLKAGETKTVTDLPLGSYAISETNAPEGVVISPNPAVVGEDGQDVKVTVTNPYPGAYLEVTKHVTGAAAPAPGTQYTVHYDGPGANDGDIVVTAGQATKVGPLPLGQYHLSETDAPTGATIVPSSVNLTANGQIATVDVTNPYPGAYLDVTKALTGQLKPASSTQYTVHYSGPVSGDLTVTADGSVTTSPALPVGTYTITELNAPAGATIVPNQVVIAAQDDAKHVAVKLTNPYPGGYLDVTKHVSGDLKPDPGVTYTVHYANGDNSVKGDLSVKAGQTTTSPALPLGTYTVTEVNAPPGATVIPGTVTIASDNQHVSVDVTNPYPGAYLDVAKVETGALAPGGTYKIDYAGPVSGTVTVHAGDPATTVGPLPLGTYTLSEQNPPAGATVLPGQVQLTANGQHVSVTATNPYPGGYLDITKLETGALAPGGTYTIDYAGPKSGTVQVTAGAAPTIVGPLPLGTYTLVEEGTNPGHVVKGTPAVITENGQHAQIVVTNPFGDPSASLDPSCAKGVVVTLANGALDGPAVVFSITVDGVEVRRGISVGPDSSQDVTLDTAGKTAKIEVFAQQGEGSVLVDSFEEWAFNCPPAAGSFVADCADGAYSVLLTNDAAVPVDATLTKNGNAVGTVTVPANGSVKALFAMDEDETATLGVRYGDAVIAQAKVTLDCVTPLTPTTPPTSATTVGGTTVLGATQTRGSLPVTGSDTGPIVWTAVLLIVTGGLAVGAGMRFRRRIEG